MVGGDKPVFDREDMIDRLGGDESLLEEIIDLYVEESAKLLGDVRRAVAGGTPAELDRAAHALRGTLLNVSAVRAVETATQLERLARAGQLEEAPPLLARLERELSEFDEALQTAGLAPAAR